MEKTSETMKRMLITGAAGFVGANLTKHFIGKYEVHVLIRNTSDTWRISDELSKVTVHHADITNEDEVKAVVDDVKPEYVIHAAVYGGYPSQQDSGLLLKTIVQGTINLVTACKQHEIACFVNTGSSSEYGKKDEPMRETDLLEPTTEYGVFKAAATLYCQHVAREEGLPIVTLRLFSVYGYYEEEHRLFPDVITAYLDGTTPELSSPEYVRDYIFIEDVVAAYEAVLEHPEQAAAQAFNVCSGTESAVRDVVEAVRKQLPGGEPRYGKKGRSFEVPHWVGDHAKLTKATSWKPTHTLAEGVEKTVKWYERQRT